MNEMATIIDKPANKINRIDTSKLLKQYFIYGLPEAEISRMQCVSREAVNRALKPFKQLISNPDSLRAYQDNRSLVFDAIEHEMTSLIVDGDKKKKATLGNVAYALDKVYNINRLEKGLSTQNVSIMDLTPSERDRIIELEAIETGTTRTTIVLNDVSSNDE